MKIESLTKICINLLLAVILCSIIYCVNFAVSWVHCLEYSNMLGRTLPFAGAAIVCLIAFGLLAECIEEKRQMEIRRKKRMFVLQKNYKTGNNIIYLKPLSKPDLYKKAC